MTDFRIDAKLVQRTLVTLAAVGAYRLVQQIVTVPGFDQSVTAEFFGDSPEPTGLPEGGGARFVSLPTVASGTMTIGTYIGASAIVLFFSGFVPFLKRLREGGAATQTRLQGIIVAVTLFLAAAQALQTAFFLEGIHGTVSSLPAVPDPGWTFRAGVVLTLAAAALLVLWLAHLVTARGLGNGVVLLLAADILVQWPAALQAQWDALRTVPDPLHQGLRVPLFILAVLILAVILVTARRKVELERIPGTGADSGPAPALPLRINPVGTMPVLGAQSLLSFGTLAFSANYMHDLSPVSGIAFCLLVALHAYLTAAITFHPGEAVERLRRYGFRLREASSPEDAARHLRSTLHRVMVPGILGLCALGFTPWIAVSGLGLHLQLGSLFGIELLVLAAVGLHLVAQARSSRALAGGDQVAVLAAETRFELGLAADVLRRAGIASQPRDNRVISATGTLAFWEVSRPRWPSLTIYRHLGGGDAVLLVDSAQSERASQVLRERGLPVQCADH